MRILSSSLVISPVEDCSLGSQKLVLRKIFLSRASLKVTMIQLSFIPSGFCQSDWILNGLYPWFFLRGGGHSHRQKPCRGFGGILPQKMFKLGCSEMLFSALDKRYIFEIQPQFIPLFIIYSACRLNSNTSHRCYQNNDVGFNASHNRTHFVSVTWISGKTSYS